MSEQNENKNIEMDPHGEEREELSDVVENFSESEKENTSLLQDEKEADEVEEKNTGSENAELAANEEALEEEPSLTDPIEEASECSCSYAPPYGAPVFEDTLKTTTKKKKAANPTKGLKAILALLVVLGLVLTFVAGVVAGQLFLNPNSPISTPLGGTQSGDGDAAKSYSSFANVVEAVAPSVVEVEGSGSGVVIDSRGYILTNEHVVSDFVANAQPIIVVLHDGTTRLEAEYLGGDARYDVAVLKVESSQPLSVAKIGKSADMRVGDQILAIGNPLATLGGTVTNGIISAKDRQIRVDHYLMTLLQIDAAVNPGNSGGGLFNMAGELVGIVNAKQMAAGIEGLGFAIPIDLAWKCAEDIIEHGYVKGKPYIGISFQEVSGGGVQITASTNEQLKAGDWILAMDGKPINKISDMYSVIDNMKIGDVIKMTVQRNGVSEPLTLNIKIVEYQPKQ